MGDNTTLTLSGANTYTGVTTVGAGTVNCTSASALGQGPVALLSGGKLNLAGGSRQVASLSLGGVGQPQGTYGSTASSATTKNDTYFSGSGILSVPTPNTPPVATAQNVSASEDVAKPITLSATDAEGNALVYTILTLPTRGALTGTPPNVTYTPPANFNGMERFTFKVNDEIGRAHV